MKFKIFTIVAALCAAMISTSAMGEPFRYVGGDCSLLPEYENAKAKYRTSTGASIPDVLQFSYDQGMNCMRVRLFVDPDTYLKEHSGADKNACQSLDYILPLCKKIKEHGLALMLDFHYSDTWADPAKQWTPKLWQGLSDTHMYERIAEYTSSVLSTLKDNGVVPDFIQPGNEISYGMLWGSETASASSLKKCTSGSDSNWPRFGNLLKSAIAACKEICPDAKIIIHTERVAKLGVLQHFYNKMEELGVDYDIIGLSYYPYFHGKLPVLEAAITAMEKDHPDKDIMVVETGYPYKWAVPGTTEEVDYAYSESGQKQFTQDLVDMLLRHESVTGLFWWWYEYNAYGTSLSGWYNAPLFTSETGKALAAFPVFTSFGSGPADSAGVEDIPAVPEITDNRWFDLMGRQVAEPSTPGIYIHNGKKILVR